VTFTSSGSCSNVNEPTTMTSGFGVCSVIANQLGNANYAAAGAGRDVNATALSQTITIVTPGACNLEVRGYLHGGGYG